MFCRFCGESIPDESCFCPFCGKPLLGEAPYAPNTQKASPLDYDPERCIALAKKPAGNRLLQVSKPLCYIALTVFLILFIKEAPGTGGTKFLTYLIGAAIGIALAVFFCKRSALSDSAVLHRTAVILSLAVIVLTVGLRIVYEAKVDAALYDVPASGTVRVRVVYHDEYYSSTLTGFVHDPKPALKIDGKSVGSGNAIDLSLDTLHYFEGSTYYSASYGGAFGSGSTSIQFTSEQIRDGCSFDIRFYTDYDISCVIGVKLQHVVSFWDVIFH